MTYRHFLILLLISFFTTSCKDKSKREAETDGIDINIKIERFDSAFWCLDTANLSAAFTKLDSLYPEITPIYLENVVSFGAPDDTVTYETYRIFRRDTAVQRIYTDALIRYKDMSLFNRNLTSAFRRAKYFFPNLATPKLYTHVSGFNQSIIVGNEFLSVSLDNYLGSDYHVYSLIGIYGYQKQNMIPEKIVPDYLLAWLSSEYPSAPHSSLLDDIIYRGKLLYVISILSPETADNVLAGYSQEQFDWMQTNERTLWNILVQSNKLYETDIMTKGQYLNDGPFTLPFSQNSPGRGGVYIGWKIVKSYMKSNPSVSPAQLMQITDGQTILDRSGYRP